ncbi:S1 family peptidase [Thermoactinospora rubra]|uniref:S1 family peptidase n=1 Tax=Thermoactinospora rubra TaxID=1088767 RepID=UPI000A0F4B48|nr:S1 family peptidase [Thermoactinospora rubra]
MRRTPALIAIAIGALVVTATPAVADPTPSNAPEPPAGMLEAMQRDLGLSEDQARRRLANEARGNIVAPTLHKQLGDRYAGAWYEGPESALVVATVSQRDVRAITRAGAEARVVARSLAQLEAVKTALDGAQAPASVHSWGVSTQDNAVVVAAADAAQARSWLAARGVDASAVKIVPSAERPRPFADIRGGDAYYIPSKGYRCSVGFAARRTSDQALGFTTAGHCGDVGDATNGYNQQAQGTFRVSSFPGNDYAWVQTNSSWTAPGVVNGYSAGILPVRGSTVTQPQGSVCRSGSTTQWRCGTVTALNQTVNYPEGTVSGLTRTTACAEGGDSGGAFISGDQAQGMTSGGSGNCTSGGVTFFQPLNEVLGLGYSLVTSDGTPPPTGCQNYNEKYTGSLSSGQNQYQPNGSYYYASASGTHAGCLDGPDGTDFDLYLQRWNGSSWSTVAQGITPNPDETISYNGSPGYYRYRVHAYSGSGSYTMGLNRP